ncbi:hypothetical protein [Qipengyuania gelatinilytica]|uniref:Uncharacterized protein n=1 Tax=Qipengyuania gelatinilytica TaxID=2867231 RepID=A0ABX8ZZA7_9SPHN|nr:hypothetical protein [Qipengyuania gelatinilytica]QZD94352.1 hypothetical protein K3136_09625 [Qipengyuania gelatinilytica]
MTTASYLMPEFEKEILSQLERAVPEDLARNDEALITLDARSEEKRFRDALSPTLVAVLIDKWNKGNLTYVSETGVPGRTFGKSFVQKRKTDLTAQSRLIVREKLMAWQKARAKFLDERDELNFASGIEIIYPVFKGRLIFDYAYSLELD